MPLPPLSTLCVEIDPATGYAPGAVSFDATALGVRLPGGAKLEAVMQPPREVPRFLMLQLSTALAPLQPLFDLVDALLIAKQAFDAVKTLNPVKIGGVVLKFGTAVDKLRALIPQVSVPILVVDVVGLLDAVAQTLKVEVQGVVEAQLRLDDAEATSTSLGGVPALSGVVACGRAQVDAQLALVQQKTGAFNRLVALLNLLGGAVGLPQIPAIAPGGDAVTMLASLDALAGALARVRAALPV